MGGRTTAGTLTRTTTAPVAGVDINCGSVGESSPPTNRQEGKEPNKTLETPVRAKNNTAPRLRACLLVSSGRDVDNKLVVVWCNSYKRV